MAGQPILRDLVNRIEEDGGPVPICERLADGETVGSVAASYGISRRLLYKWRDHPSHAERGYDVPAMWAEAIRLSAEANVEEAMAHFDELDRVIRVDEEGNPVRRVVTGGEVQLVTARTKFLQWMAAKKDPEKYGDKTTHELNLNVNDLHLQALQETRRLMQPAVPAIPAETEPEPEEADYEIA